jgi:uncharacterized membrane protein
MNTTRFEAFSDSVFAFAITLLILGISLPESHYATNHDLSAALLHLWPNLITYILSFAVIGIMWQNHQALFRLVKRVDRRTVFLNLLLLAGTAFIPFATNTLGSYPSMQAAALLYGLALSFTGAVYNAMVIHLRHTSAFKVGVSEATVEQTARAFRTALVTYVIATLFALVAPVVSFVAYVAVAFYGLFPRGVDADIET